MKSSNHQIIKSSNHQSLERINDLKVILNELLAGADLECKKRW